MAINVYGMGPTINATQWSKLMQTLGDAGAGDIVRTGLTPSVATGTRLINIASGDGIAAGVLAESTTASTVTLAANSAGSSRWDVVVLELNWSAGTGSFVAVQGAPNATPVVPALTQTWGVKWQIPLAQVLVRNGIGQIAGADVYDVRRLGYRAGLAVAATAAGWSVDQVSYISQGKVANIYVNLTRTGATIPVGGTGDVSNTLAFALPVIARPGNGTALGSGAGGRVAHWYLDSNTGQAFLSAVGGSADLTTGTALTCAGTYLLA